MCHGGGEILRSQLSASGAKVLQLSTCPACGGRGISKIEYCSQCAGEGRAKVKKTVTVGVPAGQCVVLLGERRLQHRHA